MLVLEGVEPITADNVYYKSLLSSPNRPPPIIKKVVWGGHRAFAGSQAPDLGVGCRHWCPRAAGWHSAVRPTCAVDCCDGPARLLFSAVYSGESFGSDAGLGFPIPFLVNIIIKVGCECGRYKREIIIYIYISLYY